MTLISKCLNSKINRIQNNNNCDRQKFWNIVLRFSCAKYFMCWWYSSKQWILSDEYRKQKKSRNEFARAKIAILKKFDAKILWFQIRWITTFY